MATVLITGASSGIGEATARKFLAEGWNVVATMRSPDTSALPQSDRLFVVRLDMTESTRIPEVVASVIEKFGSIDCLINNAGYGLLGPVEHFPDGELERQMAVNVTGLIRLTQAVIPVMRAQKKGSIIMISSMIGRMSFPFFSAYAASKWAVEGFSESLAYELEPFGILVKIIEPGMVKTRFFADASYVPENGPYKEFWHRTKERALERNAKSIPPEYIAEIIYRAATDNSSRLRYSIGMLYRFVSTLHSLVPASIFRTLIRADLS